MVSSNQRTETDHDQRPDPGAYPRHIARAKIRRSGERVSDRDSPLITLSSARRGDALHERGRVRSAPIRITGFRARRSEAARWHFPASRGLKRVVGIPVGWVLRAGLHRGHRGAAECGDAGHCDGRAGQLGGKLAG